MWSAPIYGSRALLVLMVGAASGACGHTASDPIAGGDAGTDAPADTGAGGAPSCTVAEFESSFVERILTVVIDRSASMQSPHADGATTRAGAVADAIARCAASVDQLAGVPFPSADGCFSAEGSVAPAPPTAPQITALHVLTEPVVGSDDSPWAAALSRATADSAAAAAVVDPRDEAQAVVALVTDGDFGAGSCGETPASLTAAASEVVELGLDLVLVALPGAEADLALLAEVAAAGGCTGETCVYDLTLGEPAPGACPGCAIADALVERFGSGPSLSCEMPLTLAEAADAVGASLRLTLRDDTTVEFDAEHYAVEVLDAEARLTLLGAACELLADGDVRRVALVTPCDG